jgi:alpha-L-rhamnosidase
MTRFMDWRNATTAPDRSGVSIGNTWGDWLNVNEPTPIEFIDTCYHALTCRMMAEMAEATGRAVAAGAYRQRFGEVRSAFARQFVQANGRLNVDSQTAYVLALWVGLFPEGGEAVGAARLAEKIRENDTRMTTGFLGTKPLLPVLTANGYHDLAVRLFQSRRFPSWGYEVANGANSVWERWDSYTREHGFNGQSGNQNASMNSFSHYAFGAVTEWMFRDLAGIDTEGPGFKRLLLRPGVPAPDPEAAIPPIYWVRASYDSPHGPVRVHWRRDGSGLDYEVELPANTEAILFLPAEGRTAVRGAGRTLDDIDGVEFVSEDTDHVVLKLRSGQHRFQTAMGVD